jgi:hypothetical protein
VAAAQAPLDHGDQARKPDGDWKGKTARPEIRTASVSDFKPTENEKDLKHLVGK